MKKILLLSLLLFSVAGLRSALWVEGEDFIGTEKWQQMFTATSPHDPDAITNRDKQIEKANKETLSIIKNFIETTKKNSCELQQYTQRYKEALYFLTQIFGPDPLFIEHLVAITEYEKTDGEDEQ